MNNLIKVAILGSTGYVGLELIKILLNHPNVKINFLGYETNVKNSIFQFESYVKKKQLPELSLNKDFNPSESDVVFLALPHGISNTFVKKLYSKIKIIDLSADFRLDSLEIYKSNYNTEHECSNLLEKFDYGLPEINRSRIINKQNISVPGCYPTSVLLPLIPLIKNNLIRFTNIIIDSKSGYSGAGKKFVKSNIENSEDFNFYNYNTNSHRHICEIQQELNKYANSKVFFSFNPHVLPAFRGMMTTIYCDLRNNVNVSQLKEVLNNFYNKDKFVNILETNDTADFFKVQNTNNCLIKFFEHYSDKKVIIVSLIDNLIKGAAGQAIQCFNLMNNLDEKMSLPYVK